MISQEDMIRVVTEQFEVFKDKYDFEGGMEAWAERNGFEEDAFMAAVTQITILPFEALMKEPFTDMEDMMKRLLSNVNSAVILAFLIGWETQKEYGKKSTVL